MLDTIAQSGTFRAWLLRFGPGYKGFERRREVGVAEAAGWLALSVRAEDVEQEAGTIALHGASAFTAELCLVSELNARITRLIIATACLSAVQRLRFLATHSAALALLSWLFLKGETSTVTSAIAPTDSGPLPPSDRSRVIALPPNITTFFGAFASHFACLST